MDRVVTALCLLVVLALVAGLGSALPANMKPGSTPSNTMCPLTFKPCPGVPLKGKLEKAQFNGTCQGPLAILKKGTSVEIDFTFTADVDESKLTSKVSGQISPLPFVDFPLDNPDACKDSGLKCPIKANTVQDYLPILNVKNIFPEVTVIVKWELIDGSNNHVFCVTIPAQIVS